MIETIYIPTYRRTQRQLTWDNLPNKWKDRALLVIAEDEYDILSKNYPVVVCPHQGKAPEGKDMQEYGLSPTRKWVAYHAGPIKYAFLDDDINEFVYTARPSERNNYRLVNSPFGMRNTEPGFEDKFDEMMETLDSWLNEYAMCGLEVTWNPPFEVDYKDCWRQTTNHFINGSIFPNDEIDFTSLTCAQDYYILLQCLTKGYANRVSLRYRVRPALTQASGGCAEYRTLDTHNTSMKKLHEAFPEFVTLKEKVAKGGSWGGLVKLAAVIQWKKAFQSSQKNKENTLGNFLR